MLKQVQHDAVLDSLNDLDLPTSILKPLIPAFALTTQNLELIFCSYQPATTNPEPRHLCLQLGTDNLQLLFEEQLLMLLILNPRLSGGTACGGECGL